MTTDHGFPADRAALTRRLFPDGVPALWSPTLVFYDEAGNIDRNRLFAHLGFMAPHVKGFLVPGSTGDAWEMRDDEAIAALDLAIDFAEPRGLDLLAGVLRPSAAAMRTLLARRFPHLLLFKDSGGADEVALSGRMPAGVTLLRGAEGDYARWSKAHGGPYDGFLLSTANAFPAQLAAVLDDLRHGRVEEAERRSAAVSAAVSDAFAAVAEVPQGNAFTNANKALAQVMAYGSDALRAPPPRLYAGGHLPRPVMERVVDSLGRHGLLPERGYLQEQSLP